MWALTLRSYDTVYIYAQSIHTYTTLHPSTIRDSVHPIGISVVYTTFLDWILFLAARTAVIGRRNGGVDLVFSLSFLSLQNLLPLSGCSARQHIFCLYVPRKLSHLLFCKLSHFQSIIAWGSFPTIAITVRGCQPQPNTCILHTTHIYVFICQYAYCSSLYEVMNIQRTLIGTLIIVFINGLS